MIIFLFIQFLNNLSYFERKHGLRVILERCTMPHTNYQLIDIISEFIYTVLSFII